MAEITKLESDAFEGELLAGKYTANLIARTNKLYYVIVGGEYDGKESVVQGPWKGSDGVKAQETIQITED